MASDDMDLFNRLEQGGDITKQDTGRNKPNTTGNSGGLRTITESADGLRHQFYSRDDKSQKE